MAIERVDQFLAIIESSESDSKILEVCKFEIEYLRNELKLTSLKSTFSRYRNAIKKLDLDSEKLNLILKEFRLTKDEYVEVKTGFRLQVYTDNTNLRAIEDCDSLIVKAESLLESNAYSTLACAVSLLSGRRITEVLKTAKFEYVDDSTLLFSGQLKTKESENAQIKPYEIPVLTDSKSLISALNNIRKMKDFSNIDNAKLHSMTNKTCNEACKRYFRNLISNVTVKDLRSIYASIAYELYCPEYISETAYHAKILGHSELDLATAQSYKDFYVVS